MMKNQTFGRLLRSTRKRAGKSMGDLARHLKVSIPYMSDVERDHRPPLVQTRIMDAAAFLGVDPAPLLRAAADHRGSFELDTGVSARGQRVGAALMRGWKHLTDEELRQIENILGKGRRDG